jgi:hypothetical protein
MSPITKEIIKTFLGLSIFKRPSIGFYFGWIRLGTPYFYPRKWVKADSGSKGIYVKWLWLQTVNLGWKTKWSSEDIRFEWNPAIHFIFLYTQTVIFLKHAEPDYYWCALILYAKTNGSHEEKVAAVKKQFSFRYITWKDGVESKRDTKKEIFTDKFLKDYDGK